MACIQSQSQAARRSGCFHKRSYRSFRIFRECRSIGFGIEFHPVGTGFGGILYHFRIGRHEYRRTDTGGIERFQHFGQKLQIGFRVPAGVGSQLSGAIRNQRYLMRFHFQHQVDKFGCGISLYIKLRAQQRTQVVNIALTDMSFIGTRMHRYTVGSKTLAIQRHFYNIRHISSACVTQCRYFINIYT